MKYTYGTSFPAPENQEPKNATLPGLVTGGVFAALARAQFLTGEAPPTEVMPLEDPGPLADGPASSTEGEEPAKAAE